jgi:hypothetical protein
MDDIRKTYSIEEYLIHIDSVLLKKYLTDNNEERKEQYWEHILGIFELYKEEYQKVWQMRAQPIKLSNEEQYRKDTERINKEYLNEKPKKTRKRKRVK